MEDTVNQLEIRARGSHEWFRALECGKAYLRTRCLRFSLTVGGWHHYVIPAIWRLVQIGVDPEYIDGRWTNFVWQLTLLGRLGRDFTQAIALTSSYRKDMQ